MYMQENDHLSNQLIVHLVTLAPATLRKRLGILLHMDMLISFK